jgi:hypothetical protein
MPRRKSMGCACGYGSNELEVSYAENHAVASSSNDTPILSSSSGTKKGWSSALPKYFDLT